MSNFKTINEIVNQVAVEVGLQAVSDVFASQDAAMKQLTTLANSCGYELLQSEAWEGLVREHSFVTQDIDSGIYDLPDDFSYMIDQTGWDRSNNVPLMGPLSPQEWQYLLGRDLVSHTIYASFRQRENKLYIFPQPPPDGLNIHFEYVSTSWVLSNGQEYADQVTEPSDTVLYEPYLFERLLKLRFLEARGFDTMAAAQAFQRSFDSWKAKDKGAPILNSASGGFRHPLIDSVNNTPDTGFGS